MFIGHQYGRLCARVQGYKNEEDLVTAVNKCSIIAAVFSPIREKSIQDSNPNQFTCFYELGEHCRGRAE